MLMETTVIQLLNRRQLLTAALGLSASAVAAIQGGSAARARDPATQRYICVASDCQPYIYNPVEGDPDSGVPPGTAFRDLPDDWYCPVCGAGKADFIPLG